jgi:protein-tyrosine phosphatase
MLKRFKVSVSSDTSLPNPHDLILYQGDPAERIIALESLVTLRDIGGYTTTNGRRVKRGLVFRSATLAELDQADWEQLNALNLQIVCDLRTREEAEESPDRLPLGARAVHLPAHSTQSRWQNLLNLLLKRGYLNNIMSQLYTQVMLDHNPQVFSLLFRHLAQAENLPALIHCTAGKDRTGLAVALLLAWLGVDEKTIIADYSLSNLFYEDFVRLSKGIIRQLGRIGIHPLQTYPLMIADPRTLEHSFEHLRQRYGGIEAYLREVCQLDSATLEQLRDQLLE